MQSQSQTGARPVGYPTSQHDNISWLIPKQRGLDPPAEVAVLPFEDMTSPPSTASHGARSKPLALGRGTRYLQPGVLPCGS